MPRDLDHVVHAIRDLYAARATYTRLGFTITPVGHNPFGTANTLVQMNDTFLQLLAVVDPTAISEASATRFSISAFTRDYLAKREGLTMLVLTSKDTDADRADFEKHGLPVYEPFRFERKAKGPDGRERTVAFSLTFTSDARVHGQAGFFTFHQHNPENFWRSEFRRHPNGALRIDSAVFVTRDPADFHEFFTYFTGQHDMLSTSLHVRFALGGSAVDILSPVAFKAYFGEDAGPDPRRFTAYRIAVADIAATRAVLNANGVPFQEILGALVVPSAFAHGATVAFVAASER